MDDPAEREEVAKSCWETLKEDLGGLFPYFQRETVESKFVKNTLKFVRDHKGYAGLHIEDLRDVLRSNRDFMKRRIQKFRVVELRVSASG